MLHKNQTIIINKDMEFEDSRLALFSEPNAYIQKFESEHVDKKIKKVVFSEPYESIPAFYINNNFKKGDCDCVTKAKKDLNCENGNVQKHQNNCRLNDSQRNDNCHYDKRGKSGLDLKNLFPLLGAFSKGGGMDVGNIVGLLNNASAQNYGSLNPMSLISGLLSNKEMMGGILNIFKGGGFGLLSKNEKIKKELKTTDFEIKNYTRVE